MVVCAKVEVVLSHDPERHFRGLTPEKRKHVHLKNCMKTVTEALSLSKAANNPNVYQAVIHKTINHIPTAGNYAPTKKGLTTDISYSTMNLKRITLSQRN